VSEAEFAMLEERAQSAGRTLSEWVRDVLLASPPEGTGRPGGDTNVWLAEVLALPTIPLNALFAISRGEALTEEVMRGLIERADANKMKRAPEVLARNSAREERMQTAPPEPALPKTPMDVTPDITPAAAVFQIPRVARQRGISTAELQRLVSEHIEPRQFGLLVKIVYNGFPEHTAYQVKLLGLSEFSADFLSRPEADVVTRSMGTETFGLFCCNSATSLSTRWTYLLSVGP